MGPYFHHLAAAYVRGQRDRAVALPERLRVTPLEGLEDAECAEIGRLGREAGLRIHAFKRATELPRVRRVLGMLRSGVLNHLLLVARCR